MQPKIKRIGPADAKLVLQADVFDGPAKSEWVARFFGPTETPDPRNLLFAAEIAGRIEGFVSGVIMDHPDKAPELFIRELGVNEAARRRGLGKALIQAIRAEGRERGCKVTWVLTEADNLPARALYQAVDAKETPDVVMYEWNEAENA